MSRTSNLTKERPTTTLDRTKANPWVLNTPPGTAEYTMHVDEKDGVRVLVCTVGTTVLLYNVRCIDDLHAMLGAAGGWVELGGADEQKPAKEGTVEAWGRSPSNPIGGWYGLKKGLRGRFGVYIPPLMEALGLYGLSTIPRITECGRSKPSNEALDRHFRSAALRAVNSRPVKAGVGFGAAGRGGMHARAPTRQTQRNGYPAGAGRLGPGRTRSAS